MIPTVLARLLGVIALLSAAMCGNVFGAGVAAASADDFYVVNSTKFPIIFASYVTGSPNAEYIRPEHQINPGEKFTVGVTMRSLDSTIKINFDTFDKNGKQIPGGMLEFWSMGAIGREPGMESLRVACWPGPERSCIPRGWGKGQTTVTFTG